VGGEQTLYIFVMVAAAIVLLGTFVLRPSVSGSPLEGRLIYYLVRVGVLLVAVMYGAHHGPRHDSAVTATDPFADPTPPASESASSGTSSSSSVAGPSAAAPPVAAPASVRHSSGGPKTMEFRWPATQPSR